MTFCTSRQLVSSHCLDTFAVHFVVFVGIRPVQTCISFLIDKQVRENTPSRIPT